MAWEAPNLRPLIEIRNMDGDLLEIAESDVFDLSWSFIAQGGYEEAVISLRRRFDSYGDIDLDYDVRILVDNLDDASESYATRFRWHGFVRGLKTILDERESVVLMCSGYTRQLSYIVVNDTFTGDCKDAAVDLIQDHVEPGTQIGYNGLLTTGTGVELSSQGITFSTNAREIMDTLAAIGGNAEWGARSDFVSDAYLNEFYFNPPSSAVKQIAVIGDRIRYFETEKSTDNVVRKVTIQGTGFEQSFESTLGNTEGFQKERTFLLPFLTSTDNAQLWATAYFARFETPKKQARLILTNTSIEVERFTPHGLLAVLGGVVQQWYGQGAAFGDSGFLEFPMGVDPSSPFHADRIGDNFYEEFRIHRVSYRWIGAGLEATVELGEKGNRLDEYFEAIEYKLNNVRQAV